MRLHENRPKRRAGEEGKALRTSHHAKLFWVSSERRKLYITPIIIFEMNKRIENNIAPIISNCFT
ncbi:TPA: hypothetical protein MHW37_27225 [Klebsiella pneumoniae]|nr:hypothetical protein [Klebsiella pneumoniae]HBX3295266.1 hypothetical protein [Klebsiella pneumoniae]